MSYETAPATKLLATRCACCDRALVDATSVEIGMGPVCRKKHGYGDLDGFAPEARAEANKLIYQIAAHRDGAVTVDACKRLAELGAVRVVEAIMDRLAKVRIAATDGGHPHGVDRVAVRVVGHVPDFNSLIADFRAIPGRRWDADAKVNTFPVGQKVALFVVLKKHFPGAAGVGPLGPFVLPGVAPAAPASVPPANGGEWDGPDDEHPEAHNDPAAGGPVGFNDDPNGYDE